MESKPKRSERVIEDFKKYKLASSVLKRIHRLMNQFESERQLDFRLAQVGMIMLLVILTVGACIYFLF